MTAIEKGFVTIESLEGGIIRINGILYYPERFVEVQISNARVDGLIEGKKVHECRIIPQSGHIDWEFMQGCAEQRTSEALTQGEDPFWSDEYSSAYADGANAATEWVVKELKERIEIEFNLHKVNQ